MYKVVFKPQVVKQMAKLDHYTQKMIKNWMDKNIVNCEDPRAHGKALQGDLKGLWRYRVGDYRIIADIQDDELVILLLNIGHRREIYQKFGK